MLLKYICTAVGAVGMAYLNPTIWKSVSINALGYETQAAALTGLGAVLGLLVGEKITGGGRK